MSISPTERRMSRARRLLVAHDSRRRPGRLLAALADDRSRPAGTQDARAKLRERVWPAASSCWSPSAALAGCSRRGSAATPCAGQVVALVAIVLWRSLGVGGSHHAPSEPIGCSREPPPLASAPWRGSCHPAHGSPPLSAPRAPRPLVPYSPPSSGARSGPPWSLVHRVICPRRARSVAASRRLWESRGPRHPLGRFHSPIDPTAFRLLQLRLRRGRPPRGTSHRHRLPLPVFASLLLLGAPALAFLLRRSSSRTPWPLASRVVLELPSSPSSLACCCPPASARIALDRLAARGHGACG